jgi:hypothetical protein
VRILVNTDKSLFKKIKNNVCPFAIYVEKLIIIKKKYRYGYNEFKVLRVLSGYVVKILTYIRLIGQDIY